MELEMPWPTVLLAESISYAQEESKSLNNAFWQEFLYLNMHTNIWQGISHNRNGSSCL